MPTNLEFDIHASLRGFPLEFKSTRGLFSTQEIDEGTKLLINNLQITDGTDCVDLGCGYGAVGVVMGKLNPKGQITFIDRDVVAIEYAKKNCLTNGITNAEFVLSNGLEQVPLLKGGNYDLIASNLPTHISNDMIRWMLEDAQKHLKKNGSLYAVTVARFKPFVKREFERIFGNYEKVDHTNKYIVSRAKKVSPSILAKSLET